MLKLMNFLKKGYVSCPNPSKSNFIQMFLPGERIQGDFIGK